MTDEPEKLPGNPVALIATGNAIAPYMPDSLEETLRYAALVCKAGWAPKSYRQVVRDAKGFVDKNASEHAPFDADKIALAMLHGREVGLKPLQSLQSIAVIGNQPSLWGDGALAVCIATGQLESFEEIATTGPLIADGEKHGETVTIPDQVIAYTCRMKRRGMKGVGEHTFTLEMARQAGLLSKADTWGKYRARMLQMRARAWVMRDRFADALKGLAIYEEVIDITDARVIEGRPVAPRTVGAKLDAFAPAPAQEGARETHDAHFEEGAPAAEERAAEPGAEVDDEPVEATEEEAGELMPWPVPPSEVLEAYGAGKYKPYVDWFGETCDGLFPADRQGFTEFHTPNLLRIREASARNQGVVDAMCKRLNVALAEKV